MRTFFDSAMDQPAATTMIMRQLVKRLGGSVTFSKEELLELDGADASNIGEMSIDPDTMAVTLRNTI